MKYFALLLQSIAVAFLFQACNKTEHKTGTPVIQCQSTVELAENGGSVSIPYSVDNGDGHSALQASTTSEWIEDLTVDDEMIRFAAPMNETGETRTCEIILEYPNAENFTVTVTQNSIEIVHAFTFEVVKIDYVTAEIKVIPADTEMPFLSLPITMEEYKSLESEDDVINHVVNYYLNYGDINSYLLKGEQDMTATNLSAGTDYVIAAFGYDGTEQTPTTIVDTVSFTTMTAPDPSEVNFTIEITEVTGTSVTARYTPDPQCYKYAVSAVSAADVEAFGSDLDKWDEYMKGIADPFIESGAITSYEDYANNSCRTGEFYVKIENIEYDTDYYAAAILVDEHLDVITVPFLSEMFTTPEKPNQDPIITLEMSEYFDGTAIAEKYPEFASFAGKAIVPVTGTFENSTYWVAGSMNKTFYDMYYEANYLEIALVDMNMCYEKITYEDYPESPFVHFFAISWGQDVMITSIAYNDSSKASKSDFSSLHVNPDTAEAADISEFEKYL